MIVKVQSSLSPPNSDVLIYDRERSVMGEVPMTEEIKQALGGRPKAYFEAQLVKGIICLGQRVKDQAW